MLSEWNRNSSPSKQNISPDRKSSPKKHNRTINQLLNLLKTHKIPIPVQLLNPYELRDGSKLVQSTLINLQNTQSMKKLQVQISDYKFQLKKIDEDFAQYKVITKIDKQKLVKKYNTQIQYLKKKIEYDNNNWQNKFKSKEQSFIKQKEIYQKNINLDYQERIRNDFNKLKAQYHLKIQKLSQQIQSLKSNINQKQKSVQEQKDFIIKNLIQEKEKEINSIKQNNSLRQKQITLNLQTKIQLIEFQKKIQLKKHEQVVDNYEKLKLKLNHQIYFLQKDKEQLNKQIRNKQRKINQLQLALRLKDKQINQFQRNNEKERIKIMQLNQKNIKQIKQQHQAEIKNVAKKHLNELDSYYQKIINLEQRKQKIQAQYKTKMNIMEQKFHKRISKCQDLQQIQSLRTTIVIKERQLSKYQQDLKMSQMQRSNNEKNYTRIFSSNSSRRKSASNTYRDKEAFFKQTNPTDLKMLLKICHKEF